MKTQSTQQPTNQTNHTQCPISNTPRLLPTSQNLHPISLGRHKYTDFNSKGSTEVKVTWGVLCHGNGMRNTQLFDYIVLYFHYYYDLFDYWRKERNRNERNLEKRSANCMSLTRDEISCQLVLAPHAWVVVVRRTELNSLEQMPNSNWNSGNSRQKILTELLPFFSYYNSTSGN